MKIIISLFVLINLLTSCNKNIFGLYDTSHSKDKSMNLSITIKKDGTIEKDEIHTIRIYSKGTWQREKNIFICYFDSTETGFPRDTLKLQIQGKNLFFFKNGTKNTNFHLRKTDKINGI